MGFGGVWFDRNGPGFCKSKGMGVQRVFVSSSFFKVVILKGEGGLSSYSLKANSGL